VQEAGEEADKEAEGRGHGPDREADLAEDQFAVRRESCLRLRDEGRPLPGADDNERGRPQVPHLQHGGRAGAGHRAGPLLRRGGRLRTRPLAPAGAYPERKIHVKINTAKIDAGYR
jgi:hypothetical protein